MVTKKAKRLQARLDADKATYHSLVDQWARKPATPPSAPSAAQGIVAKVEAEQHGAHLSTKLTKLIIALKDGILDETLTVPELVIGLDTAVNWSDQLDHRRTALDPSCVL